MADNVRAETGNFKSLYFLFLKLVTFSNGPLKVSHITFIQFFAATKMTTFDCICKILPQNVAKYEN